MPSFTCPDCGKIIPGTNCAFSLSRAFEWTKIAGCYYHCKCGYPVRAKELRDNKFKLIDNNKSSKSDAFIYCENKNGQGHVYYGTFDQCVEGNGYTADDMKNNNNGSIRFFGRYTEK